MDELTKLKRKITVAFKLSGFVIRSEDGAYLAQKLLQFDHAKLDGLLNTITENLQVQSLQKACVDRKSIDKALAEINRTGLETDETIFALINAFEVPRFCFNNQNKKFELHAESRSILAKADMKSDYLRQRYAMLLQKTMRHELFAPAVFDAGLSLQPETKKFKLQHAENLLACSNMRETVMLGLLTQMKEGSFYLEDSTGAIKLDMSAARFHTGFFCEGCFVLAEGSYRNGVLKVDGLGFPPAENAASSRAFFGTQNSWGGASKKLLKYSPRLQQAERSNPEATIVFLSDVRLDVPAVMERLKRLFIGFDSCPPIAIVLMGPFVTSTRTLHQMRQHFTALGALAAGCEQLKQQTDLILVPACDDPTAANILPRQPLPKSLISTLHEMWPRVQLATNPCRLQYCTQQIVVCRLDLMAKFCRNTLHFPEDTSQIQQHFARTLLCQNHLIPVHPIVMPVHWDYDAALWLYPLPDLIVIGDSCHSFDITQHNCTLINTGSFPKSKFAFKVYMPATRTVEDSEIADNVE